MDTKFDNFPYGNDRHEERNHPDETPQQRGTEELNGRLTVLLEEVSMIQE